MRYGPVLSDVVKMVRIHPGRPLTFSVCTALCLISAAPRPRVTVIPHSKIS